MMEINNIDNQQRTTGMPVIGLRLLLSGGSAGSVSLSFPKRSGHAGGGVGNRSSQDTSSPIES